MTWRLLRFQQVQFCLSESEGAKGQRQFLGHTSCNRSPSALGGYGALPTGGPRALPNDPGPPPPASLLMCQHGLGIRGGTLA